MHGAFLPHLAEPGWGAEDPETPLRQRPDWFGQLVAGQVLVDQRIVRHEHAMLEREIHGRGGLPAGAGTDLTVGLHLVRGPLLDGVPSDSYS